MNKRKIKYIERKTEKTKITKLNQILFYESSDLIITKKSELKK